MTATVHGHADPAFQGLRTLMQELIESGEEDGASLVINVAGQNVVDLWGGYADAGRTQPWAQDTITNIWSSTKPVAALATLMLVDRQLLDLDAPVAQYWPEFGAEGKADVDVDVDVVLVKHLLAHTSGLSGWEQPFSVQDLYDWDTAVARLARQKPWWAPGSASGYHSLSYGHLLGELVRRVTGQSLRHFVRDHIAGPLQADLQIGAEEQDWSRIAPVVPPPPPQQSTSEANDGLAKLDPDSISIKTFTGPAIDASDSWSPEWRRRQRPLQCPRPGSRLVRHHAGRYRRRRQAVVAPNHRPDL